MLIAKNEFYVRLGLSSTWVFFVVVLGVFSIPYLIEVIEFHGEWTSGWSHDILIGPKYFMASLLTWFLLLTTFGTIYLGCNVRTQSIHNRIYEALESRPVANLELVTGTLMSFVVLTTIPIFFALIFVFLHGFIDRLFGLGYGDTPEVWSTLAFVFVDVVPNLAFWGALAIFLTMLLRSRLGGAILTCSLHLGWCVLTLGLPLEILEEPFRVPTVTFLMQAAPIFPLWLLDALQSFSASAMYPSELAPIFVTGSWVVQRLFIFLFVTALLCGAALFYPRSHVSRKSITGGGVTCVVIAATLLSSTVYSAWGSTQEKERWAALHTQMETSEFLDLEHISGHVELKPAKFMLVDLTLRLKTPDHSHLTEGIFAFNPGFRIEDVFLNGTRITDYEFQDGLLRVPWKPNSSSVELQVIARGTPRESFAYLDSGINVSELNGKRLRRLRNLGTKSTIFHPSYIALLPGAHWYPTPGVATGRENLDEQATDFHTFNLQITTKRDWLVSAPGRRERIPNNSSDTYRFQSSIPVSSIAVVSSRFVRRAATVEGVEFEFLISPRHASKLEHLASVGDELKAWLGERLQQARLFGLEYPYESFSIVEVPSSLRIFGGGWQMDSILGPPGMFLVRESGLLSVRFDREEYQRWDNSEQRKRYALTPLLRKLELNLIGDNPYKAFSRNLLTNQTNPTESGAVALRFVLDQLITKFVTDNETYFSIRDLLSQELGFVRMNLWLGKDFAGKYFDQHAVWFCAEAISLSELREFADLDMCRPVFWHKGYAIIRTFQDFYGSDGLGAIFSNLREHYGGRNFSFADLSSLTPSQYSPIDLVIGELLLTTNAPGYIASPPAVFVVDREDGTNEYLTSFVLYNDEETPGFIRIYDGDLSPYELEGDGVLIEPIWFEGKQAQKISIRSEQPFRFLYVIPYFSLNRAYLKVFPDPPDEQTKKIKESNVPSVVEPVDWQHTATEHDVIVVDDLDPEFSIVNSSTHEPAQQKYVGNLEVHDPRVLPHAQYFLPQEPDDYSPREWHRVRDSQSIGKHRRTWVRITNGRGLTAARFEAVLPKFGLWELEYNVIHSTRAERYVRGWYGATIVTERKYLAGDIAITVSNGTRQSSTEFDFVGSKDGWKLVGQYDIVENDVAVLVSDAVVGNRGTTVYADAIRWTFVGTKNTDEASQK